MACFHLPWKDKLKKSKYEYNPNAKGFLDLPPEIRNQIYDLALLKTEPIIGNLRYQAPSGKKGATAKPRAAGLLLSCKQIRRETLPVYYGGNTFLLNSRMETFSFLTVIGSEKRAMIRHVHVIFRTSTLRAPTVHTVSTENATAELEAAGLKISEGALQWKLMFQSYHWKWAPPGHRGAEAPKHVQFMWAWSGGTWEAQRLDELPVHLGNWRDVVSLWKYISVRNARLARLAEEA